MLHSKERQRIFSIDPVRVAHRDANLANPPQSFFDQALMAAISLNLGRLLKTKD